VCRVHGGSAPQVRLAAQRRVLAERVFMAYQDWQDVHDRIGRRGTCAACGRLTPSAGSPSLSGSWRCSTPTWH
jgi:hypothetical protein